jgi:hypothetical protein
MLTVPRHYLRPTLLVAALVLPAVANAQGFNGSAGRRGILQGRNPAGTLIDARRELNLSTRQLVQLDSIERGLLERNREVATAIRARSDSLTGGKNLRELSTEERQALREKLETLRPLRDEIFRNDSVARVRAFSVLDSSQKSRASSLIRHRMRRDFAARRMQESDMRDRRDMRRFQTRMHMRDLRRRDDAGLRLRDRGFGRGMGPGYRGEFERRPRNRYGDGFGRFRGRDSGRRFRDDLWDSRGRDSTRQFREDSARERPDSLSRRDSRRPRRPIPRGDAPADTLQPPT